MKVGVISSSVFKLPIHGYGGLEHVAWLQAKGLAERGHEVTLFAPDDSSCPGCTVFPFGPAGQWGEDKCYDRYWKELPKHDVILDHSWNKFSVILKMEGKLTTPCLLWLHAPVTTMFSSPPPVDRPCLVAISRDQARFALAHLRRRALHCYNGCDPTYYKNTGARRSGRYLFLARFSTVKGPLIAIEACRKAGVALDLVGDTTITNEPDYFRHCQSLCDGTQIRMVGPASRGECVSWFSQAKALLHPIRDFAEPLGLTVLESQLCETPVISWDNGAPRETIKHGETGFLVESEEELVELLRTDAVASLDGKRCREWVAGQFTVEHHLDRTEELMRIAVTTGGW